MAAGFLAMYVIFDLPLYLRLEEGGDRGQFGVTNYVKSCSHFALGISCTHQFPVSMYLLERELIGASCGACRFR